MTKITLEIKIASLFYSFKMYSNGILNKFMTINVNA